MSDQQELIHSVQFLGSEPWYPTLPSVLFPPPWPTVSCFPAVNDLVCYLDPIAVTGSLNESLQLLVNPRRIVEDILVFSKTWDEHVEEVRRLFA